jgi:hypothetical protein
MQIVSQQKDRRVPHAANARLRPPVEVMGNVERIEQDIQALSPEELAQFRAWFLAYDWAAWDRQLERDVQAGKLDKLADRALRDHNTGKTKPL